MKKPRPGVREQAVCPITLARVTADARILLISGSTRRGSGNTAALRTVQALAPDGITATIYAGLSDLPAFNPDDDHETPPAPVADLRGQIAAADAVMFCTPEYAGTLPGSFKNLLDWTVGGGEIYRKPVGWINVAAPGRGLGAEEHLKIVLGYVGTVPVEAACVRLPVPRDAVGTDGIIPDPAIRQGLSRPWWHWPSTPRQCRSVLGSERPRARTGLAPVVMLLFSAWKAKT